MKNKVKLFLEGIEIPYRWVDHPAVFTVEDAEKHVEDKHPIKNLFIKNKSGQYYLVIMSGVKRLDTKLLAQKLNSQKLSFASPERLKELLNLTPGSVSLFGLMNDSENKVQLVIERDLLNADELGFHPNDNTATVFVNTKDLNKIVEKLKHSIILIDI